MSPLVEEGGRVSGLEADRRQSATPSLWGYPATYFLLSVNITVFIFMLYASSAELRHGNSVFPIFTHEFNQDVVLRFGATHFEAVQKVEWWRLITANFVHITFLHLAVNMWCLWNLGLFGEPLLGKPGLIAVYLLTGTSGMMLSLAWSIFTRQPSIVAGASGAIFGLAGILIVLLSNRKLALPWEELRSLRRSVVWFAVLNLAIGVLPQLLLRFPVAFFRFLHFDPRSLPRVDNHAHFGGLVAGLALGVPLFPRMTSGKSSYRERQVLIFGFAAFWLCLLAYALAKFSS